MVLIAKIRISDGNIVNISDFEKEVNITNETFYINGNIDGLINEDYTISKESFKKLISHCNKNSFCFNGDFSILSSLDDTFKYVLSDSRGINEIFYHINQNILYLSDNIFELTAEIEELYYDLDEIKYFINHRYCRVGKTIFKDIKRIPTGKILLLKNSKLKLESYFDKFKGVKVNYDTFKNALNSTFKNEMNESFDHAVLLSGGVDSSVLAGSLKNLSTDVKAVTMFVEPVFDMVCNDIERSEKTCKLLDIEQEFVHINIGDFKTKDMEDLIFMMPLAAHLSINFLETFRFFSNKKINFWCGQNCDTLYNLGPTGQFDLIQRFLLSLPYIKMLNGVNGHKKYIFPKKIIDNMIRLFYNYAVKQNYQTPNNFNDLLNYFMDSNNYLALSSDPDNIISNYHYSKLNSIESKNILFDEKLGSFYTGGDNKSVINTAKLAGVSVSMPYSSNNMVNLFRNLDRSWNDIIFPKRFLYDFAQKELKIPRKIYSEKKEIDKRVMNHSEWCDLILKETEFGNELMRIFDDTSSMLNYHSNINLDNALGFLWINKINEKLEKENISINYSTGF